MKLKILSAILGIIVAVLLVLNQTKQPTSFSTSDSNKLTIEASFYPLAYWASEIAGEDATVRLVTETGSDPHAFSLSPSQRIRLQQADVFLFNGAGLDHWAEDLHEDLEQAGVITFEAAAVLDLEEHEEEHDDHEEEEAHHDEDDHGHDHGSIDPHFWLDLEHAQTIVAEMQTVLAQADPENAANYLARAQDLQLRLQDLDSQFRSGLNSCQLNTVVVAHDAYGYLSEEYGFSTLAITGLSPDARPSAKTYAELQSIAKEKKIDVIFFETFVDPKITEAFANEIGATTLVLHPLEGLSEEQVAAGETYFTLMQNNLQNLQVALKCS